MFEYCLFASFVLLILKIFGIQMSFLIVLSPILLCILFEVICVIMVFIFIIIIATITFIGAILDKKSEDWLYMYINELEKICDKYIMDEKDKQ